MNVTSFTTFDRWITASYRNKTEFENIISNTVHFAKERFYRDHGDEFLMLCDDLREGRILNPKGWARATSIILNSTVSHLEAKNKAILSKHVRNKKTAHYELYEALEYKVRTCLISELCVHTAKNFNDVLQCLSKHSLLFHIIRSHKEKEINISVRGFKNTNRHLSLTCGVDQDGDVKVVANNLLSMDCLRLDHAYPFEILDLHRSKGNVYYIGITETNVSIVTCNIKKLQLIYMKNVKDNLESLDDQESYRLAHSWVQDIFNTSGYTVRSNIIKVQIMESS